MKAKKTWIAVAVFVVAGFAYLGCSKKEVTLVSPPAVTNNAVVVTAEVPKSILAVAGIPAGWKAPAPVESSPVIGWFYPPADEHGSFGGGVPQQAEIPIPKKTYVPQNSTYTPPEEYFPGSGLSPSVQKALVEEIVKSIEAEATNSASQTASESSSERGGYGLYGGGSGSGAEPNSGAANPGNGSNSGSEPSYGGGGYGGGSVTWSSKEAGLLLTSIDISREDGRSQTATTRGGRMYMSWNYGDTWAERASDHRWTGNAVSDDGICQTAVDEQGDLCNSYDNGATWTPTASSNVLAAVDISSNGLYQATVAKGGYIWGSTNYGGVWTATGTTNNWFDIKMSRDGQYRLAVAKSANPTGTTSVSGAYISYNYGVRWTPTDNYHGSHAAMSDDGQYQMTVDEQGWICDSSDYGNTWVTSASSNVLTGVDMCSNGQYRVVCTKGGNIWYSGNSGQSWSTIGPTNSWNGVSMSRDAMRIATIADDGNIYEFRRP